MEFAHILETWGESAKTSAGFFWKAGWAFVLGYFVSAMIQTFVPKSNLTDYMGDGEPKSIALASAFGAISSSCSFAALSTARALVLKGARFVEAVAFMFASTNLVIELGILIFIFLGWEFLAAELIGGVVLIVIASVLMKLLTPDDWLEEAREKVEEEAAKLAEDFDWRDRIASRDGWQRVGKSFVGEWKMVWAELVIGFSIAGLVAVAVPTEFWETIFLVDTSADISETARAIQNAFVGPIVAMMTFIGSMGNIPLATVLNDNGVMFAGIMAFIYSDLVVPPLVMVNKRYYGWKIALTIAGIMYVSMVATALLLWSAFEALGAIPETERVVQDVTRFSIDYTFWLNISFVVVAGALVWLHLERKRGSDGESSRQDGDDEEGDVADGDNEDEGEDEDDSSTSIKEFVAYAFIVFEAAGIAVYFLA